MRSFEKEYYESETFWEGEMLQDPANQLRIRETASIIPPDVVTLADIGCGNGVFVNYLADNYKNLELTGVDRSATALKYVKVNKVEGDVSHLPLQDSSFDCVTCLEVIEHLPVTVYKKALQELVRVARHHIIISVPYAEKLEVNYTRCPSCRTIFNKDIHLRSFNDEAMENLLTEFGFKCVYSQKLNKVQKFVGHDFYRKLFYPEQLLVWNSPICPICGYVDQAQKRNSNSQKQEMNGAPPKRKLISYLTGLPKLIWPKETYYYWILSRYERVNT
jgi:ubiquinone/menaquinone biosynthesis C-methylase UbiE